MALMAEAMNAGMGRLAETEKYIAWVLENRDPRLVEFERVRRRTMGRSPPMTRAELKQAARGAKAWAADFVWRAETGLPLWLGGDPARLLEIDFERVDWVAVALAGPLRSGRRSDQAVQTRPFAHALNAVDARNLREEGRVRVFATDPVPVGDDELEPLLVMNDVARSEVPPDHLRRDLP
jgi:hypothetical protein